MIKVEDLVCGYHPGKPVVGPLSFEIGKGDIACLIGPNGIGKTTLFKTILGLLKPLGGVIFVNGKNYRDYSAKEFARTVAYVPQGHIPPFPYTVRDVVVMGCNPNMQELSSPGKEDYAVADEMLELMNIRHLANRDYTEISGGVRQMVMISRALAQQTRLLVMDEPTTHLDYGNETLVLGQVRKLAGLGYTIVMITHAPSHAFLYANRALAIGRDGLFVNGDPSAVLTEESLLNLYGVGIQLFDVRLKNDQRQARICMPMSI
ncbi:MAG: ABC transporter ATP-binding protein [Clostridiaceae bacterium]|nr:ABC transporter ATP-binding protein [Clostridiaceae bacterium]